MSVRHIWPNLGGNCGSRIGTVLVSLRGGSGLLEVGVGHEGHLGHLSGALPAAHGHLELRAGLAVLLLNIAHGHVLLEAGAEGSARDLSNLQMPGHMMRTLSSGVSSHEYALWQDISTSGRG